MLKKLLILVLGAPFRELYRWAYPVQPQAQGEKAVTYDEAKAGWQAIDADYIAKIGRA